MEQFYRGTWITVETTNWLKGNEPAFGPTLMSWNGYEYVPSGREMF